jgi:dTDP-glucose pyrophosphorylase
MLNILIPMAGEGSRFAKAGYTNPKPLIQIKDKSMIQLVVENVKPDFEHRFIFICQRKHFEKYPIKKTLSNITENPTFILLDEVTEGAACTALLAEHEINNSDSLMIVNSDQFVNKSMDDFYNKAETVDGLIMTMLAGGNKWSYCELDEENKITSVKEKVQVSDEATVGLYFYKKGSDFVAAAHEMIAQDDRTNNEFYIAPVYNYFINGNVKVEFINYGKYGSEIYSLGTPEDLEVFLKEGIL